MMMDDEPAAVEVLADNTLRDGAKALCLKEQLNIILKDESARGEPDSSHVFSLKEGKLVLKQYLFEDLVQTTECQ